MQVKITQPCNESVLTYLKKQDIYLTSPCGGNGVCGKCQVKVLAGEKKISEEDKKFFEVNRLKEGYRLACHLEAKEGQIIEVNEEQNDYKIVNDYKKVGQASEKYLQEGYGIAIDIGTTTIAFELLNLYTHEKEAEYALLNSQRQYGADVVSRIDFSSQGGEEILKKCLEKDIFKGISELLQANTELWKNLKKVVIAGNTVMLHTLMGENCESLGKYPFVPHFLDEKIIPLKKFFPNRNENIPVILMPGLSAYVGADITSGLYFCNMLQSSNVELLLDLGTNGEMAIGNREKVMCTATAAGPAFEGGNLSCGVGSVKGAIASAKYLRENFYCETIGGVEPIGICGSGILDIIAQSLEHGLIDESGYILNETGKIEVFANDSNKLYISQKDIREFQLAKAAIRAGIETLILSYGVKYNQIKTVYLAGGFGKYVDINSILKLGILPYELSEKIIKVGNSSLGGATSYLAVNEEKGLKNIREKVSVINLAEEKVFNELLIKYMTFDE